MANKSVSQLTEGIRWRAALSSTDTIATDSDILSAINSVYKRTVDAIINLNEDFYYTTSAYSLSASKEVLVLPSNFRKAKVAWVSHDGGTTYYVASPLDKTIIMNPSTTFSVQNPIYMLMDTSAWIQPAMDTAAASNFKLDYLYRPSSLTSAGTPDVPEEFDEVIEIGATSIVMQRLQKWDVANILAQEYAARMQEALNFAIPRQHDNADRMLSLEEFYSSTC